MLLTQGDECNLGQKTRRGSALAATWKGHVAEDNALGETRHPHDNGSGLARHLFSNFSRRPARLFARSVIPRGLHSDWAASGSGRLALGITDEWRRVRKAGHSETLCRPRGTRKHDCWKATALTPASPATAIWIDRSVQRMAGRPHATAATSAEDRHRQHSIESRCPPLGIAARRSLAQAGRWLVAPGLARLRRREAKGHGRAKRRSCIAAGRIASRPGKL